MPDSLVFYDLARKHVLAQFQSVVLNGLGTFVPDAIEDFDPFLHFLQGALDLRLKLSFVSHFVLLLHRPLAVKVKVMNQIRATL
jgi:hypothetical protein